MTSTRLFKVLENGKNPKSSEFLCNSPPIRLHIYCLLILLGSRWFNDKHKLNCIWIILQLLREVFLLCAIPWLENPTRCTQLALGNLLICATGFWHNNFLIIWACLKMVWYSNIHQRQREWCILWMFYQSIISSLLDVSKEDKGLTFPGVSHVAEGNAW